MSETDAIFASRILEISAICVNLTSEVYESGIVYNSPYNYYGDYLTIFEYFPVVCEKSR